MLKLAIFFVFLSAQTYRGQTYVPPAAWIQPLSPIGIRLSIPDEAGIKLVAFHVKINEDFVGLEQGTIARDIVNATKGEWVYQDKSTKLKKGDTIYYWIHVIYNNLGYNLVEQRYVVDDFYDYNGNKIQSCKDYCNYYITSARQKTDVNKCHTQCYIPPVPLIEPLTPAGIRMSIPDEAGISLVAFHVKVNNEFVGLEAGAIARDIVKAENGHWTYYDTNTKLKKDDTIYYWIYVIYKGLGYNLVEQQCEVTDFFDENGKATTEFNKKKSTTLSSNIKTTKSVIEQNTTQFSSEKKPKQPSSARKSCANDGKD